MKLDALRIGDLVLDVPIIQGGMGVGVSKASLAGAVSEAGGLGVIASVGLAGAMGQKEQYEAASRNALIEEIQKVKKKGLPVGVNVMVVLSNYASLVKTSIEAGADVIISGAGLPIKLPQYAVGSTIKLVPIVSSGRAAELICKTWLKRYDRTPDAIVVEGPLAGGHLGFQQDALLAGTVPPLADLIQEVLPVAKEYGEKQGKTIPVLGAGGVYTGEDIAKLMAAGAGGVQMGTRFVATHECDASDVYKQAYLDAREEDVVLVLSPVGLPARVLKNAFVEKSQRGEKQHFKCFYRCLISCQMAKANYCIAEALVNSVNGDLEHGYAMCGENVHRIDKIVSVSELMKELTDGAERTMDSFPSKK